MLFIGFIVYWIYVVSHLETFGACFLQQKGGLEIEIK